MISTEFLLTSLVVVMPGTGVIYTVSTGLLHGRRASIFASLGCALGIVPHLAATLLGLAAVLHASALAFQALKVAGALYLLSMAVATWRDASAYSLHADTAEARHRCHGGHAVMSPRPSCSTSSIPSRRSSSSPSCRSLWTLAAVNRCPSC